MQHSVYIHIPFCEHRCAYCDFNTYAGLQARIPAYVQAVCREISLVAAQAPADVKVHTVFFGGGTPSLLSPEEIEILLRRTSAGFRIEDAAEITLEANPGTVSVAYALRLRRAGINRISLGVQSANGEELRLLERKHTFRDVLGAISAIRAGGIRNLNLDLIYGLPEQSLGTWKTTVERILLLAPEHISAYCLTLEYGTPFGQWSRRGSLPSPDPDVAADMYEWASERFASAGYCQYEISNWARPGMECRHNLQYWRNEPYFGFGAGAHGYVAGFRYSNVLGVPQYTARLLESQALHQSADITESEAVGGLETPRGGYPCSTAALQAEPQDGEAQMMDHMLMGLRLTDEGVGSTQFARRFGFQLADRFSKQIDRLLKQGLIEMAPEVPAASTAKPDGFRLRLTRRGRLLGNRVFSEFVADAKRGAQVPDTPCR